MKQTLIDARAKIANPEHWTQNHLAKNAEGVDTSPKSPDACKWCALGAVQAAVLRGGSNFLHARIALSQAARELYGVYDIVGINDDQGHAAVLACFDRAIEVAK